MGSSYEATTLASIFSNFTLDSTTAEETANLPYEIPDCPSQSILYNLYYFPDKGIQDYFLYQPTDKIMISVIFPIIVVVGVFSNAGFLLTIARVRDMRTLTNFYLANLACADLFFALITTVRYIYPYIWHSEFSGGVPWETQFGCAATSALPSFVYYTSICLVTLVSIERYLAICHPLKHRMVNKKSRTVKMVAGSWLLALILAALTAPVGSKLYVFCMIWPEKYQHRLPKFLNFCNYVHPAFQEISSIIQFTPFFVALVLNTVLYSIIIIRLSQRDVSDQGEDKNGPASQAKRVRNSVARMLVINGIIFFLCLAPWQFFNLYNIVLRNFSIKPLDAGHVFALAWVARCLNVLNSAVNPIIYSVTNARYRQAFLKSIGCSPKKRSVGETTSSTAVSMVTKVNDNAM